MSEHQAQIDQRLDSVRAEDSLSLLLPSDEELPLTVELSGRPFMLNRFEQEWVVYPATCPHQMGPLTSTEDRAVAVNAYLDKTPPTFTGN